MRAKGKSSGYKVVLSMVIGLFLLNACEVAEDLIGSNETVTKIEGEWSCDETSDIFKTTASVYTVYISADPENTNGIIIDNFYGVGISVKANVIGKAITIPNQTTGDDYTVYGSGTVANNYEEINFDYRVDDGSGGAEDHATAVYTKVD